MSRHTTFLLQGLDLCVQITNITGKWCPRSKGSSIPNGSEALLGVSQLLAAHDKVTAELEEVRAELQEVSTTARTRVCVSSYIDKYDGDLYCTATLVSICVCSIKQSAIVYKISLTLWTQ